jgi:hypothetical protein
MSDDGKELSKWDYRIFRGQDGFYSIGEVYYDSEDNPVGWIQEGMAPCGDSVEELISCLKLMLNATNKPVFQPPKEMTDDRNRD